MTTYFTGIGGSNLNNGTTWALRKATIAAGIGLFSSGGTDTLYIGPGTYRENPSTSVNGASSNPHTVIGDEGGTLTDGIGGEIRITGSDNDQTATRANGITCANNWWTFRGLHVDTVSGAAFSITGNNIIVEQSAMMFLTSRAINCSGASCNNITIRRCVIGYAASQAILFTHSSTVDNTNNLVENCIIIAGGFQQGINIARIGGVTIRNCLIAGFATGIVCSASPSAGQVNNINNCIIAANNVGIQATATTDLTEDYNTVFANVTSRTNVNTGANSKAWTPLLSMPLLTLGIHSWIFGELSANSQIASIAGAGVPSDDMVARTRVATSSWGPMQYIGGQRFNDISPLKRFGGL